MSGEGFKAKAWQIILGVAAVVGIVASIVTVLTYLLAIRQTELAERQTRLAEEQFRSKYKNIDITAIEWDSKYFKDSQFSINSEHHIYNPKVIHIHLKNVGEVPIDTRDFQLGPYIMFPKMNVLKVRQNTCKPPDFRVDVKIKERTYVQIIPLVDFKIDDFISVDVLLDGEIGDLTYTYRIKGGSSGTKSLEVDPFQLESRESSRPSEQ